MARLIKKGLIRSSAEFKQLIAQIQAEYAMKGKKAPSTEQITKALARQIKSGDIRFDKYKEL